MKIIALDPENAEAIDQAARLLMEEFRNTGSTDWLELEPALAEVEESLSPDRISRIAVDDEENVLGWIGGIPGYAGNAWELHPLVVRSEHQGRGVGRSLVEDLEVLIRKRGAWTIWLGTDDENGRTNLGGIDLYPDPLAAAGQIRNRANHPFEFYQRLGYQVVGVLPDANGFGKPDIFMAKRVRRIDEQPGLSRNPGTPEPLDL